MLRINPSHRRRLGAAAVEFAVVSLIFFTFLFALVDFGRGLMTCYALVNTARRAARVGVVPGRSTTAIKAEAEEALARGGVKGAQVSVQVNGSDADASTAQAGDPITVTVRVPVASVTWLPFSRYLRGNLTGEYTLTRE